ncbi:flagellar hook assembly protein FlgD [Shewanella intestini]|uniref:Basal-body rod modification protein FlgD n=1 Tax=Shewanella intestini TaxID=2017544 RepID=A0ABS5HZA0_9GAMM|nr:MULTISPECIES: flagellar hook assembly protein FlgD [Shewanella]MBR9726749.1 flagellar hook assembly protein FlgD [Shewanella intestini]MRG34685.1 flagellar biosynthesis protein FlgD [Shewanella sp. XMDDZSB0408]
MSLISPYSQSLPQVSTSSNASSGASSTIQTGGSILDGSRLEDTQVKENTNGQMLKQEDFFALLSQQLSMQDPSKPVDNDQMIAQMASFSTVDGISNLNKEIVNLNGVMSSSQALQASGLVGRKVLVPSGSGYVSAENPELKGVVSAQDKIKTITMRVEDDAGQLIKSFDVDGSGGGNVDVTWDGLDKNGDPAPAGNYTMSATGSVNGESQSLAVSTYAHVTSVSLGTSATGAVLNLRGIGGIKLSDVLAVSET